MHIKKPHQRGWGKRPEWKYKNNKQNRMGFLGRHHEKTLVFMRITETVLKWETGDFSCNHKSNALSLVPKKAQTNRLWLQPRENHKMKEQERTD